MLDRRPSHCHPTQNLLVKAILAFDNTTLFRVTMEIKGREEIRDQTVHRHFKERAGSQQVINSSEHSET